jgi:hypothetical protein
MESLRQSEKSACHESSNAIALEAPLVSGFGIGRLIVPKAYSIDFGV